MTPGEKIRVLISIRKASMRSLSDRTGIPISTVRAVINDGRILKGCRAATFSTALGVDPDWLWSDRDWDTVLGERNADDARPEGVRAGVEGRSRGLETAEDYAEFKRFEAFIAARNQVNGVQGL